MKYRDVTPRTLSRPSTTVASVDDCGIRRRLRHRLTTVVAGEGKSCIHRRLWHPPTTVASVDDCGICRRLWHICRRLWHIRRRLWHSSTTVASVDNSNSVDNCGSSQVRVGAVWNGVGMASVMSNDCDCPTTAHCRASSQMPNLRCSQSERTSA